MLYSKAEKAFGAGLACQGEAMVEIENVACIVETPNAILCQLEATGAEFWVPKSLISDDSEVYKLGTEGKLVIPEWLAVEKELL